MRATQRLILCLACLTLAAAALWFLRGGPEDRASSRLDMRPHEEAGRDDSRASGMSIVSSDVHASAPDDRDTDISSVGPPQDIPADHREGLDATGGARQALEAKKNRLRAQWTEYVEFLAQTGHFNVWIYPNKITSLDALLKDMFSQAVHESGSFDGAMKQLQDLIRWQEVPAELLMGGLQKEVRDPVTRVLPGPILPGLESEVLEGELDDFDPIIVYLLPDESVNSGIGFFVNAYPTKEYDRFYRVRTPPYALMLSGGDVRCADLLPRAFTEIGSQPWAGGHNILMVDTFDIGDAYPCVALVDGPGGGGGHFIVSISYYDQAQNEWRGLGGTEYSEVGGWTYDQSTKTLEVKWHPPEETRIDRIDMRDLLKEGLAYRAKRKHERSE